MARPSFKFALDYYKDRKDLVVVEVGVNRGGNAIQMFDKLSPQLKTMYLVDPYNLEDGEEIKHDMLMRLGPKNRAKFIDATSVEAALLMESVGITFDYVYIDGDHSYDMVMLDLIMWYPLVKKGGILAGHDWSIATVRIAVEDFFKMDNRPSHCSLQTVLPNEVNFEDWWVVKNV